MRTSGEKLSSKQQTPQSSIIGAPDNQICSSMPSPYWPVIYTFDPQLSLWGTMPLRGLLPPRFITMHALGPPPPIWNVVQVGHRWPSPWHAMHVGGPPPPHPCR